MTIPRMPNPVESNLCEQDEVWATLVGDERYRRSKSRGDRDAYGLVASEEYGWEIGIEGSCTELAAANGLWLRWPATIDRFKDPDLPYRIQVRGSRSLLLIVRKDARDDDIYLLVQGYRPNYFLVGWIYAREARELTFLDDRGNGRPPAYFVHARLLHDIADLRKIIYQKMLSGDNGEEHS